MFKDYKSVIIVVLLFFLFGKKAFGSTNVEDQDTFIDENNDASDCKCEPIILNELTERAFEQDIENVTDYYDKYK